MTTKTWIEVAVEVEWEWDENAVKILNVSTCERNKREPHPQSVDLSTAITPKQTEQLAEDCRTDWMKQMKDAE